ncbi:MAG: hypothetical protein R2831_02895 [Chitinophagaceae bacterium]
MKKIMLFIFVPLLFFSCQKSNSTLFPNLLPQINQIIEDNYTKSPIIVLKKNISTMPYYAIAYQYQNYAILFHLGYLENSSGSQSPELISYTVLNILGGKAASTSTQNGKWNATYDNKIYAGKYYTTTDVGATMKFTTSNDCSKIGIYDKINTSAYYAVVDIDGNKNLANKLPTAQELINQNMLPATCLTNNGGTLNPTDRIYRQHAPDSIITVDELFGKTRRVLLADNLSPGTHSITFKTLPYSNTMGNSQFLIAGIWYNDSTQRIGHYPNAQFEPNQDGVSMEVASDINFAFSFTPSGFSANTWVGHASSQYLNNLTLYVNNNPVNFLNIDEFLKCNQAKLLINSTCKANNTPVSEYTQEINWVPEVGLQIHYDYTWTHAGFVSAGYIPQLSVNNDMNEGEINGITYTLDGDQGASYSDFSTSAIVRNTTSHWKITSSSPSFTKKISLQDRNGGSMNKIYFVYYLNDSVQANDQIHCDVNYTFEKY